MPRPRKRIAMLSLGGTIAMKIGHSGTADVGLGSADLAAGDSGNVGFVLEPENFMGVASAHLTIDDIERLAQRVVSAISSGADGVVITQGTDTIEEAAFALDALLDVAAPVVVTGAMRNASLPGADGPANVIAAGQAAASNATRGLGVLVAMNDEIHSARFVQKRHTSSPAAFVSPSAGPLGWIVEGQINILMKPALRSPGLIERQVTRAGAKVSIVKLGLGHESDTMDLLEPPKFDGLVVEALGGGHTTPALAERLGAIAQELPVILASRAGGGPVLRGTYGFQGSEVDLISRGLIPAGYLDGLKARMLLSLMVRRGCSRDEILDAFEGYSGA